jgi:hypothetical protein
MKLHYPFGQPPDGVDVLWRCEAKRYSYVIDADSDQYGVTSPRLEMSWWRVSRRTPKGAWTHGHFVLLTARKKWACQTQEDAIASFIARKNRQIAILTAQLRRATDELELTKPEVFNVAA